MRNKLIFYISLIGFLISGHYLYLFISTQNISVYDLYILQPHIRVITFSIFVLILSFYLRAANSYLLVKVIKPAKVHVLFRALAIGSFYNAILPFRIGEFLRAYILGKDLSVSRTVMFFTILAERMVDCFIISAFSVVLIFLGKLNGILIHKFFYLIAGMVFVTGLAILCVLYVFYKQEYWFLKLVYNITDIFVDKIKNKIRHIVWSAIYGINIIVKQADFAKYVVLSLVMWFLYLAVPIILVKSIFGVSLIKSLILANSNYLCVFAPSGPGYLGTFHYYFSNIISVVIPSKGIIALFTIMIWGISVIPIAAIGCLGFIFRKLKYKETSDLPYSDPKLNKLYRETGISIELSNFFDEYFSCNKISHIVNSYEIDGTCSLIDTFEGGSTASTFLFSDEKNGYFVRKIALPQHASKLEKQFIWLNERQNLINIPKMIKEVKKDNSYYYDMEFLNQSIPFFNYIHTNSLESSKEILTSVVNFMSNKIYVGGENIVSEEMLGNYVEIKVLTKVKDASLINNSLANLIEYDTININGTEYDNLTVVIEKILSDNKLVKMLSQCYTTPIHGDLTIANIFIFNNDFIILDPNDENYISDPVVDFAKLFQSLHSGYEFLCLLEKVNVLGNNITFDETISSKYNSLFKYLVSLWSVEYSEEYLQKIFFHEAVHYCRMLTYRARINPETLPAFYAVATRILNKIIRPSMDSVVSSNQQFN